MLRSLKGSVRKHSTFSNQSSLPRLPIPDLGQTQARYKRSLVPLLSSTEYQTAAGHVDRFFSSGLADKLQKRLGELDAREKESSWLDTLWLQKGYLEYRIPTLINVNWWNQFRDIDLVPSSEGQTTDFQLQRASGLIASLVDYSNRVNSQQIPAEASRSGPFCMNQLKNMFGTSRIAASGSDRIITQWPCLAKHINVIYQDQIYSVDVIGPHGEVVSTRQIRDQLNQVIKQVEESPKQPPVGVLTTEHRDTWGPALEKQPTNAASLENIDRSIFVFCLDDYCSPEDPNLSHRNIFHGRNGRNRWFDKALQFIVENNGRAGINGEHSPADAVVPCRMIEEALERETTPVQASPVNLAPPTRLRWDLSSHVQEAIRTAQTNASNLIQDLDSTLLIYDDYGADFMKKAKISPDGWLQMAFQLAYYRHYGEPCPTYESASTRKFLTGRTETVRSCSVESVAFTKAWEDRDVKMATKLEMFQKAIASQSEYMKAASNGQGVDRHLLGLRCQMTPEEAASQDAAIFQDPSYWGSQYWRLSTSNTSPGISSWGGFGAVVPEGYGINYAISKERTRMSISSWNSYQGTDSASFRKTIRGVLDEFGQTLV
ncbi:acyltransferase ChoActase/COT/CPT [Sporodiniella umbellata]|nr:acyltransferase ChoActase/COT/CPT [Sporodiniella umbellata]